MAARQGCWAFTKPQPENYPSVCLDVGVGQVWMLALEKNWFAFQQEFSVLGWQALDLVKHLLLFPKLHSLSITVNFTDDPPWVWRGFQDLEDQPFCSGCKSAQTHLLTWNQPFGSSSFCDVFLGSSNYMSPKGMKCSTKWVSERREVSPWQAAWSISVVVNSSAMSYLWLVDFKLQCNRWWWCPSGIYRWPYSRTDDGDSFLGKKCSVTVICR